MAIQATYSILLCTEPKTVVVQRVNKETALCFDIYNTVMQLNHLGENTELTCLEKLDF